MCDYIGGCVHVVSLKDQGELLYSFGEEQLNLPHSICIRGGLVYVSIWSGSRVFMFSKEVSL